MDLFDLLSLMQHRSLTITPSDVNMANQLTRTMQNLFVPPIPHVGDAAEILLGNETPQNRSKDNPTIRQVVAGQSRAHSSVG